MASGAHHSLAMTADGKVYGWGDAESGKIGRMSQSRRRIEQSMKIETVGAKDAVDYYTEVAGEYDQLMLSFDWPWLAARFRNLYNV